jgi:hypothetical protein
MTEQQLEKARKIKSLQRELMSHLPINYNPEPYFEITILAGGVDIKKYNDWLASQNDELQKQFDSL